MSASVSARAAMTAHEGPTRHGHSCQRCSPADPHGNRAERREAARLAKRGVCWCKTDDDGQMVRTACPSHHDKDTTDAA